MRVPVLERWLSMVLVLLQIIMVQVDEDILLARMNQADIKPDFLDTVRDDKLSRNTTSLSSEQVKLKPKALDTNIWPEPLNRCQQLPPTYKRLIHDLK